MKKQKGIVLIITVVMLFFLAVLSLYSMRGTIIQDKMTANINNKTITMNVAEAGASEFKVWLKDYLKNHEWPNEVDQEKFTIFGNLPREKSHGTLGLFGEENDENGYYWVDRDNIPSEAGCTSNPCWIKSNKLIILNVTGYLVKGRGDDRVILGESVYSVKIKAGSTFIEMPALPAALTLAGDFDTFGTGNSGGFKINGGLNNVAIATDVNFTDSQEAVNSEFRKPNNSVKKENYTGSCESPCTSPLDLGMWGNAEKVLNWVDSIKNNSDLVTYYNDNFSGKVNTSKPIIIVDGDLNSTGKVGTFNGILIVLGSATFNGNFGTINGGVYVGNIDRKTRKFSNEPTQFNGGGTFSINYNKNNMTNTNDSTPLDHLSVIEWVDVI